jgi:hypothetical protein
MQKAEEVASGKTASLWEYIMFAGRKTNDNLFEIIGQTNTRSSPRMVA